MCISALKALLVTMSGVAVNSNKITRRISIVITKKIKVQIKNGLEARPVAVLVQVASQYESSIYVECKDKR